MFAPHCTGAAYINGAATIQYYAVVDSGAGFCSFPLETAIFLGLDLSRLAPRQVIGVGAKISHTCLDLITVDLKHDLLFRTEVGFSNGLDTIGLGLLGSERLVRTLRRELPPAARVFTIG